MIARARVDHGSRIVDAWRPWLDRMPDDTFELVTLTVRVVASRRMPKRHLSAVYDELDINTNTITARFVRAGLPSLKRIVDATRLLTALSVRDGRQELCVTTVADVVGESSAQSFWRFVMRTRGITAGQYLQRGDFDDEALDMAEDLFGQYADRWGCFCALTWGRTGRRPRKDRD